MTIHVRFFASLRERVGKSAIELEADAPATATDIWRSACGDLDFNENILVAVNHDYVERDHLVADGDEVAFFPPVTGG